MPVQIKVCFQMNGSQLTSTSFKAQLGLPDCLHENRKEESGGEQDNIGAAVDTAISKVLNAKVSMVLRGFNAEQLKKASIGLLRSSLFLSTSSAAVFWANCGIIKLFGGYTALSAFISGVAGSLPLYFIEEKRRRETLYLYVAQFGVDCLYNMIKFRGIVNGVPNGEVYVFSAAMAAWMYLYRCHPEFTQKTTLGSVIRFLLMESRSRSEDENSGIEARPGRLFPAGVVQQAQQSLQWLFGSSAHHPLVVELGRTGLSDITVSYLVNVINFAVLPMVLQAATHAFATGYAAAIAMSILPRPLVLLKPAKLLKYLTARSAVRMGAYLSGLAGVTKSLSILLPYVLGPGMDGIVSAIAGGLGGLAMMMYPSGTLALYVAAKVVEMLCYRFAELGFLPRIPYLDAILYAAGMGVMNHVVVFEPHVCKRRFYADMVWVTQGKLGRIDQYQLEGLVHRSAYLKRNNLMPGK